MKYCHNCGEQLSEDCVFCTSCGASQEEGAAAPTPVIPAGNKGKNPKVKIIVGAIAGIVVLGIAGVSLARMDLFKKPQDIVVDSFTNTWKESKDNSPFEEIFGANELLTRSTDKDTEISLALKVEDSNWYGFDEMKGLGFNVKSMRSFSDANYAVNAALEYENMALAQAQFYLDKNDLMLAVPELYDGVFTLNYSEDINKQLKKSPLLGDSYWAESADLEAVTDYMGKLLTKPEKGQNRPFDLAAFWERFKAESDALDKLKDSMEITKKDDTKKTIDGKSQSCRVYEVVIPGKKAADFVKKTSRYFFKDKALKADFNDQMDMIYQLHLLSDPTYGRYSNGLVQWDELEDQFDRYFLEGMEDALTEDIEMIVTIDKKGRLVSLEAETEIEMYDETVTLELSIDFKGGSYLAENMDAEFTVNVLGESATISMEKTGSFDKKKLVSDIDLEIRNGSYMRTTINAATTYDTKSGDYEIEISNDGFDFTLEGTVVALKKGESLETVVDQVRFSADGYYMEASGSFAIIPLKGKISPPAGDKTDIMKVSQKDWFDIVEEINDNMEEISDDFGLNAGSGSSAEPPR